MWPALLAVLVVAGGAGAGAFALTGGPAAPRETATHDPLTAPAATPSTATPDDGASQDASATPSTADTPPATPSPTPTPTPVPSVVAAPVLEPRLPTTWASDASDLPEGLDLLHSRLQAILAELAPSLEGTDLSIAVRDNRGRAIFDVGEDRRLMPASTMKVVSAASVLQAWPVDHRFRTRVAATGVIEDGTLDGDLVLVGGGDPVLTTQEYRTWVYPARPATSLESLADAVADAGITVVDGALVGDASGWGGGGSPLAAGWRDVYLAEQDARYISPLTIDAGLLTSITLPEDDVPQVELHPHADPATYAVTRFAALLAERGVSIRQSPRVSDVPVPVLDEVAHVDSPPLADLLAWTLQRSDNHLADTLVRAAGRALTGDGSWSGAHRGAVVALAALGLDPGSLRLADGSGLSRLDRVTAGLLAEIDAALLASPAASVWSASQARAGELGTLRNRLVGTAGQGRFLGKTGTLDDVKAVVGHVVPTDPAADDRRLHLAVIANGVPVGGQWAVTVLMDRLQLALVDHLDGCTTAWDDDGAPIRACPETVTDAPPVTAGDAPSATPSP